MNYSPKSNRITKTTRISINRTKHNKEKKVQLTQCRQKEGPSW